MAALHAKLGQHANPKRLDQFFVRQSRWGVPPEIWTWFAIWNTRSARPHSWACNESYTDVANQSGDNLTPRFEFRAAIEMCRRPRPGLNRPGYRCWQPCGFGHARFRARTLGTSGAFSTSPRAIQFMSFPIRIWILSGCGRMSKPRRSQSAYFARRCGCLRTIPALPSPRTKCRR